MGLDQRPKVRSVADPLGCWTTRLVLLRAKGRGRLTEIDAERRVQKAIERMRERKEIKAPQTPNADWAVIGSEPKAAAESE